jgi:hypothetical protein
MTTTGVATDTHTALTGGPARAARALKRAVIAWLLTLPTRRRIEPTPQMHPVAASCRSGAVRPRRRREPRAARVAEALE